MSLLWSIVNILECEFACNLYIQQYHLHSLCVLLPPTSEPHAIYPMYVANILELSLHYSWIKFRGKRLRPIAREGGSRGFEVVCSNPPFLASKRFYMHRLTVHFKCPTVWNWSTSLDAIENYCRQNNSSCSYASLLMEDQRGICARINTCINKLLFQALTMVFLVMSPHLLFSQLWYFLSGKFEASWLSKCTCGQPKIGCNTPWAM